MMGLADLIIQRPGLAGWGQRVLDLEVEGCAVTRWGEWVGGQVTFYWHSCIFNYLHNEYGNMPIKY